MIVLESVEHGPPLVIRLQACIQILFFEAVKL